MANERMETNLPGVYAIGDLVGRTWLAHVAETEGEIAAENAHRPRGADGLQCGPTPDLHLPGDRVRWAD